MLGKMPGDEWQKFANLRLLLAYQFLQPGKKLLFMGAEFGQWNEWNHDTSLDWHLVKEGNSHNGLQKLVGTLNWLYRTEPALHGGDTQPDGFRWVDCNDAEQSTLSWLRQGARPEDTLLIVCNFTPVLRTNFRVGAPQRGFWKEVFNSDSRDYGGSGQGNLGGVEASPLSWHAQPSLLTITLPPLSAVMFKPSQR
jgi:1,4-alpha-glucan branching enzyme